MNNDFANVDDHIRAAQSWLRLEMDPVTVATAQVYATLAVAEAIVASSLRAQQSPPGVPPSHPAGTGALDASG